MAFSSSLRGRGYSNQHRGHAGATLGLELPRALSNKHPFPVGNERAEIAGFVHALTACDAALLGEFLRQLDSDGDLVLAKMRQILVFPVDIARERTYQDIALPLLQVVAGRAFLGSIHTTAVKKVLQLFVGQPAFIRRVCDCIESHTAGLDAAGLLMVSVASVASVLSAMVHKLPDSAADDEVYRLIQRITDWVRGSDRRDVLEPALTVLETALEICMEFVPARRDQRMRQTMSDWSHSLMLNISSILRQRDQREAFAFERGPRHDNDHADFRRVRILPTEREMLCLEPPHLPTRPLTNAPMEKHLDFQFRLLREDSLAPVRRGLQWLLHPSVLASRSKRTATVQPPRDVDAPALNVATHVRLERLHGSLSKGVMATVSAAQPTLTFKTKESLQFWDHEQWFKPGTLVCLACNVSQDVSHADSDEEEDDNDASTFPRYASLGARELIFATVGDSGDQGSDLDRFTVHLQLPELDKVFALAESLNDRGQTNLLVEVKDHFFTAVESVLRTLQHHDEHSLMSELKQCLYEDSHRMRPSKPAYSQNLSTYDLQFLVRGEWAERVDLSRVPVESFQQLSNHLRVYERCGMLVLDASQVEALAAALTQHACLIQGPPGTGKSYVGTKVVRAILNQPGATGTGPILCVCYTNHALDQFIEGLVDDGIPLESIIRVGNRSKSRVLEKRLLKVVKQTAPRSREDRYRFGKALGQCKAIETEYFDTFVALMTSPTAFLDWMETFKPHVFAEIVGSEDAHEWMWLFGQTSDAATQRQRWNQWRSGASRLFASGAWAQPQSKRTQLIATWEKEWKRSTQEKLRLQFATYKAFAAEAETVNETSTLRILKSSQVVGITTSGCAIHQALLRALAPKIVVCEEAGEVLEAHLLACLTDATQQLIQIGDHLQLRPIVNEYTLSHASSSIPRHSLDVSLFERLVEARRGVPGSLVTLHVQRRMRPEICDLIRHTLYPQLVDGPNVLAYPTATRGFARNLWFLDHDEREDSSGGGTLLSTSHTNAFEAELVVELVAYLGKQGYGVNEITVLTPYAGQVTEIRRQFQAKRLQCAVEDQVTAEDDEETKDNASTTKTLHDCVRLSTVDNFQGNESQIVLISTVRSNVSGTTGFLQTFNRVNVLLSRAKSCVVLLGSASTVRRSIKASMLNRVLDLLEEKGAIGRTLALRCQKHATITEIASASEIRERSPDGGCRMPCDEQLRCGRKCPRRCHADDPRHAIVQCHEIVPELKLPCGHVRRNVPCADSYTGGRVCRAVVSVRLPFCGDLCAMACAQARALKRAEAMGNWKTLWRVNVGCEAVCDVPLTESCSHECELPCGLCLESMFEDALERPNPLFFVKVFRRRYHAMLRTCDRCEEQQPRWHTWLRSLECDSSNNDSDAAESVAYESELSSEEEKRPSEDEDAVENLANEIEVVVPLSWRSVLRPPVRVGRDKAESSSSRPPPSLLPSLSSLSAAATARPSIEATVVSPANGANPETAAVWPNRPRTASSHCSAPSVVVRGIRLPVHSWMTTLSPVARGCHRPAESDPIRHSRQPSSPWDTSHDEWVDDDAYLSARSQRREKQKAKHRDGDRGGGSPWVRRRESRPGRQAREWDPEQRSTAMY